MGTNTKNYNDHQRTFNNHSPSNKKHSPGSQRPSPSKSINIRTPNKNSNNGNVAGYNKNNYFNNNNSTRLSLSGSPTSTFFAASKCFESPSPDSLPRPPANWMTGFTNNNDNVTDSTISSSTKTTSLKKSQAHRARKALVMPSMNHNENKNKVMGSCATEYAAAFSSIDTNDHFTQSLKLLLNVTA